MPGLHSQPPQSRTGSELEQTGAGWFRMRNSNDYLKFAEECDRLAGEAKADHHRTILREMAATWRTLAKEAERNSGPKT
jgi:hypothetical protein